MKIVALLTALATAAIGIVTLASFDYDRAGTLQFYVNEPWIDAIHCRYIMGCDGMSLPLYILTMVITLLVIIYSWNHIPEPGNPKAFFILILILEVGMAGHVRGPGPHPVLRLLRGRAAADVLHDRRLGRRAAAVRLAQVLPLHPVRLGPHAAGVPRPVLQDRRASVPNGFSIEYLAAHSSTLTRTTAAADLRRHVPRLRHQGADVPVPHLAARRPHPGADRRLGDPGRHPAEARHLRLHPHRHPDPARRRPRSGRRGSAGWRSSASSTARSAASPRPT